MAAGWPAMAAEASSRWANSAAAAVETASITCDWGRFLPNQWRHCESACALEKTRRILPHSPLPHWQRGNGAEESEFVVPPCRLRQGDDLLDQVVQILGLGEKHLQDDLEQGQHLRWIHNHRWSSRTDGTVLHKPVGGTNGWLPRTFFSGIQPFEWRRVVIRPHSLQVRLAVRRSTHGPILPGSLPIGLWRCPKQRSTCE